MCVILSLLGLLTSVFAIFGWVIIFIVAAIDFWRMRKHKVSFSWQAFRKTWIVCAVWVSLWLLLFALLNVGKMTECNWWSA
jgi:hypothetical protein